MDDIGITSFVFYFLYNILMRRKREDVDWDALIQDYLSGDWTTVKVAKKYGVAPISVTRERRNRGLPGWPHGFKKRTVDVVVPSDPTLLAYMAGLIDGEGTLQVVAPAGPKPYARLTIANNHRGLMDWLQQTFGGRVYWRDMSYYKDDGYNRQPQANWHCADIHGVFVVTRAVQPYLIIKKPQSELVLGWLRNRYPILDLLP